MQESAIHSNVAKNTNCPNLIAVLLQGNLWEIKLLLFENASHFSALLIGYLIPTYGPSVVLQGKFACLAQYFKLFCLFLFP